MREMKDSGISWVGEIPLQWNVYRNKDGFINTKTIVGENSKNTPLLSLTTKGIKLKDIDNPEGKQPESFDTYQCVEINDLVMCLFDLDISAVFSGLSSYNGMISPAYKVLKCNERVIAKYADYWFRYIFDGRKFNQYAKNIRYTLTYDVFSALPMLYPSVGEQQNIADYLDNKCTQIDTIIAKEQSVIDKLQEYKKALITEAVTKGLNPNVNMKESDLDWIGKVPETYSLIKLKFLGEYFNGLTYSPDNLTDVDEGVLVLRSSNIKNGKLVLDDNVYVNVDTPRYLVKKNDILICSRNGSRNLVGKNILLSEDIHAYFGAFMMIFRLNSEVYSKWVYYVLNSNLFLAYLGSFFSSTINQLTGKDFGNIIVPICDVEEAKQITECLDEKCSNIDSIILKKQFTIDKLIEYKKSLIYEVVTGKKAVPHV